MEALQLLENFFAIDKCIFEQQLGLNNWERPPGTILEKFNLPSYRAAIDLLKLDNKPQKGKVPSKRDFNLFQVIHFFSGMFYATTPSNLRRSGSLSSLNRYDIDKRYELHAIQVIMEKIATHSEWLQDSNITDVLDTRIKSEKVLVKIDHVFSALGITNMNSVNSLKNHFLPYLFCPNCPSTDTHSTQDSSDLASSDGGSTQVS